MKMSQDEKNKFHRDLFTMVSAALSVSYLYFPGYIITTRDALEVIFQLLMSHCPTLVHSRGNLFEELYRILNVVFRYTKSSGSLKGYFYMKFYNDTLMNKVTRICFDAVYKYVKGVDSADAIKCLSWFLPAGHASYINYLETQTKENLKKNPNPKHPFDALTSLFYVKCLDQVKGPMHWESMVLCDKWNPPEYIDSNGKTKKLWQGDQLFRSTPIRIREYIRGLGPQADPLALLAIIAGPSKLGNYDRSWYEQTEKQNFAHNWFTPG